MTGIGTPKSDSINPPSFIGESDQACRLRMAAQLETLKREGLVVNRLVQTLGLETFMVVEQPEGSEAIEKADKTT